MASANSPGTATHAFNDAHVQKSDPSPPPPAAKAAPATRPTGEPVAATTPPSASPTYGGNASPTSQAATPRQVAPAPWPQGTPITSAQYQDGQNAYTNLVTILGNMEEYIQPNARIDHNKLAADIRSARAAASTIQSALGYN